MRFISYNVCGSKLRKVKRLLLYSECLEKECPLLIDKYSRDRIALSICMEELHLNMVGFKLAGMLRRCPPEEIVVLAVDGSPHCVQMFYAVEEALKVVGDYKGKVIYLAVSECKVEQVDPEIVKTSRFLTKVKKLASSRTR